MFKNIEELKNKIVNYLKDIIKNENNKNAIELINKSGYLAAEAHGQIKVYTDREKTKKGSLHLAYCEISGADGRENNRHAKQFIKDNTIQSLLAAAAEEVEKDNLKLNKAESTKYLLIDLQDKINNYFNSLSIDIENLNVRFSDHNIEYYLRFSESIGDKYFNIYFKLQGNQYLYNDTYKEEKHIFKNVEEILKHFINEISPAIEKKVSFLKMYSIVENNFKSNIDKKILFKNRDSFYTATIDNQYITLYEVNRKKEKPIYNYLYLNQFIDLFIKDNIDRFIVIDSNTDLSIKNLRNLISSNNNCIMIHEEAATDREENQINDLSVEEENKNSLGAENMNNKKELKPIFNTDIEGHEEYQKEELKKYNSGALNFTHKRINNNMIDEYTKYFIYKDNTFMSVKPGKDYPSGYYDHVRSYNYKVDHVNKIILFTDKEIEEVEPIKEEFYNNEVEPAAEETEQEQQDRENKEYIYNFIEEHRHIEKIDPFIENNKIEYFVSIQNYIQVFYIDKDNYNFNAVIEDYQFIKRNVNSLEVEGLIQSAFSIMKNYKNYKVIDHNFIKYEIDVFQCIDLSILDIKDIIRIDNIKDITIESDLITMYKDNKVIAYIDIKKDIPGFTKYTDTEQRILLKYYYDKLTESNISYYLIDNKVINQ